MVSDFVDGGECMDLDPFTLIRDSLVAIGFFVYVMVVVLGTKKLYEIMISRGMKHNVAVYYNRKVIHMAAGGVVALALPFVFHEPFIPFIFAMILALLTYIPHRKGKLMHWFQVEDNIYEVNFCIAWGIAVLVLWLIIGDPRLAILPPMLISFGDAVTGIVRNALFGRRTKHWIGNLAMAGLTIPLGLFYAGIIGGITSALASIIERFEFNPIDDNILIGLTSTAILLVARALALV